MTVLVVVVAAAGTAAAVLAPTGRAQEDADDAGQGLDRSVAVVTAPCAVMEFVRGVRTAGDVAAVRYALVSARVSGTLDEVLVDEGDAVVGGETVLFRADADNLTRAVEVARREVDVAESSWDEAGANRRRLEASLAQVQADRDRHRRLVAVGAATEHELELIETRWREVVATAEHADALVALADARRRQAGSRQAIAEKDLADSAVLAPIDGRVVARYREPGEMAAAGTPVLRIEDLGQLELTAFLPEEHYTEVVPGTTEARVALGGAALAPRTVTFRGPVVDSMHRNFEVKVAIPDPPPGVVPGRLVQLTFVLEIRRGLGVPRAAVLRRGGRSVVFVVEGGVARSVPVEVGLRADGHVELVTERLAAGDEVVVEGQDWLEDGAPVTRVLEN